MSGFIKAFKVEDGDKDKNNKLISFRTDDEKLLVKSKTIGRLRLKTLKYRSECFTSI